jgi:hypothetical protein
MIVIFDGWREADPALDVTRWIAERTEESLAGRDTRRLVAAEATRNGLERACADPQVVGVALFAHGLPISVMGTDGTDALDRDNCGMLNNRWAHAFACNTGVELANHAAQRGARCFVGYGTRLLVEWEPAALPGGLVPLVVELVTVVTSQLSNEVFDDRTLRARVSRAADAITTWLEANPAGAHAVWGLALLAQQLVDRLVVRSA